MKNYTLHKFRKSNLLILLHPLVLALLLQSSLCNGEENSTTICPNYACPKVLCELKGKNVQKFCDTVKCIGIEEDDCPPGSIFEDKLTMCGCCPGCAKYLNEGEDCEIYPDEPLPSDPNCNEEICPIIMNKCAPGLYCPLTGMSELRCTVPNGAEGSQNCHDKFALYLSKKLHWAPSCELDGSYSMKQCKGEFHAGTCFCVNKVGKRIFGDEWWDKAENQTCACSRQVYELREGGNIASIHCTPDGNYEPLQCDYDSGICYCIDPTTGKTNGAVAPESLWKTLPCFSTEWTNGDPDGQYLRQCESEYAVAKRLALEASLHGLTVLSGRPLDCDYDGSYAPRLDLEGISTCVTKDGKQIGNNRDIEELRDMRCRCLRDEIKNNQYGIPFQKECEEITGNYNKVSAVDQFNVSCVDEDGFFFGPSVESRYRCCLVDDCSKETDEIKAKCFNPTANDNKDKVHPCSFWPT